MKIVTRRGAQLLPLFLACAAAAQTAATWTQQFPQTSPPARGGYSLVYDSAHGEVVLFGGADDNGNLLNDTWVWDGTNWTEKSPATSPSVRSAYSMAYDTASKQTVLFGGAAPFKNGFAQYLADTWVWDGTNWTQQFPQASPPAESLDPIAYDSAHSEILLINDDPETWVWNGTNWIRKYPQPSPTAFGTLAYDFSPSEVVFFDWNFETWLWDGTAWTSESTANHPPLGSLMVYDAAVGNLVSFGGSVPPATTGVPFAPVNPTWFWNGTNWVQQFPATSPPAGSYAIAYDSAHGQIVLFGGGVTSDLNTTWTYGIPSDIPAISGVVSASAFGGFSAVAPGSWVEIYGSNLAPDTRGWAGTDFSGSNAPTSLDKVEVTIGGQSAFVDYISPTQVNAQLPSNIATGGMLQLTITNAGATSAALNLTVNETEPGLLAPTSFKIGTNQYVVAQHADGSYVLPTGAIAGLSSSPAKPGEIIVIYGVGFGAVSPNIPAGEIVGEENSLSATFQMLFGGTAAVTPYYGLAPNFVGLYQFNVTVPAVADNDLVPLTFNLGSVAGSQTLFTTVHE